MVNRNAYWRMSVLSLLVAFVLFEAGGAPYAFAAGATAEPGGRKSFGTVTGSVRDSRGNPLAGAVVTLLREGADEVIRQTKSASDGTFVTKVAPGRYLLRAVAEGFNAATFTAVQISPSSELVYRFNLEPVGQGRTAPERRPDRNDAKFRIRASQTRRSIFQHDDATDEVVRATEAALQQQGAAAGAGQAAGTGGEVFEVVTVERGEEEQTKARTQGVVETFFTYSAGRTSPYAGVNFAVASPLNQDIELIFAGQLGAVDRLETTARIRAGARHQFSATVGGARLSLLPDKRKSTPDALGQLSLRAIDEWVVRDGVVVVLGIDYSRFLAAGGASSLTPRVGFRFDANARTRLRAAYAPGGDEMSAQSVAFFENAPVVFREQARQQPIAFVDGNAVMERSRRLEFGIERVLDSSSTIEATAFFDTTDGRGVGLLTTPVAAFSGTNGAALLDVANQQGAAKGMRVVYTRRIGSSIRASAGYAFGRGQKLSSDGIDSPEDLFQSGFFQTAAAQLDADVTDDTRVRTVLRFSPRASVFAIDPFAGRLAVYDPSLSILVTHELPNFGLPVHAEAVIDARNLLDVLNSVEDGESILSVGSTRRMVRGGISVRF